MSAGTRVGKETFGGEVYCGRDVVCGYVRHAKNTEIGDRGWLGNPFVVLGDADNRHHKQSDVTVVKDRETSVKRFTRYFLERVESDPALRKALVERVRGNVVGCWCRTVDESDPVCHGDVIAAVADGLRRVDP